MLREWKKRLDDFIVKPADFDYVQDVICENNRRIILGFMSMCLILLFIMLGTSFVIADQEKHKLIFLFAIIYVMGILLLVSKISKQNRKAIMIATYLTIAGLMLYGILISYNAPGQNSVTFIGMMFIVAVTFVDKPKRIALATAIGTIVFLIMVQYHKAENIRVSDTVNAISFAFLSIVGCYLIINIKVRGYIMDKQLKQYAEELREETIQDPMTGVKNKRAWQETERRFNEQIQIGTAKFAIVVCDINGLKTVNDTTGHEAGDKLIIRASRHICKIFSHSPVYRIGGDEFTVILEGDDLSDYERLLREFDLGMVEQADVNPTEPPVSIALGISHYQPEDTCFAEVVGRADIAMYKKKTAMKGK